MEETDKIIVQPTDLSYVKLLKNTKGYNWEIKLFEGDGKKDVVKQIIADLNELNNLMLGSFSVD